eukprot:PITA_13598
MTSNKELFSNLEEKDLQMHIKMDDDGRYSATGIDTVIFQREFGSPLTLRDVMYVPSLKKNLVFVSMLEDRGYDVIFSKGKVFLHHIATRQVKRIGVRVKNLYKLEVEGCIALSPKAEKLLAPKEEAQDDVEQPHAEEQGVETPTHAESSRDGRKHMREADRLLHDARENVGAPTSQCKQRRSPERYTGYMDFMSGSIEIEPSSFEEAMQQPVWFDAMVEECDSVIRNSVWEVVARLIDKSVVRSRWIYKVKQATDGSVEKHKARFMARGFSQVEGIDYDDNLAPVAMYSSIRSILALST